MTHCREGGGYREGYRGGPPGGGGGFGRGGGGGGDKVCFPVFLSDTQAVSRPFLPFSLLTFHTATFVTRVSWLADNALAEPCLLRRHVT